MDFLLADVDVAAKAGRYVIYALAVAGGFLIGNLLTLLICRVLAKMMFKRKLPEQLERALRVLGGILLAALVAWLLFQFGSGWGLGGTGTGEGEGSGGPTNQTDQVKGKAEPNVDPKSKEPEPFLATGIKVTVWRASAFPNTFLFEGETQAVELSAAKEKLRKRIEESKGNLKFVDLVVYKNSTALTNSVIEDFENFAYELGLKTARKKLDQSLPE
ncbi:MAG TPA: hypothetical protein VKD90_10540 [Gemmataceae bacterium]|nr:hypothetical protein [Gemmataceae bacterium]